MPPRLRTMVLVSATIALNACNDATTPESVAPPVTAAATADGNRWVTRADMPTARTGLTAVRVQNSAGQSVLYAIGGRTDLGSVSRVEAYNVATNSWTRKAELPIPLYWTNGAGVINGKIYVSGGLISSDRIRADLYVYDPAANGWTRKRDMPNRSYGGITGVINNQLYVLTKCASVCADGRLHAFHRYNPATNSWASLPTPRITPVWGVGGTIDGKFYVTGGEVCSLEVYDPATNRWTTKRSLPSPCVQQAAGATLSAKLYVIGGYRYNPDTLGAGLVAVNAVRVYDPTTDQWNELAPLPTARAGIAATRVILNGVSRIEVVGGKRPGNNVAYIP